MIEEHASQGMRSLMMMAGWSCGPGWWMLVLVLMAAGLVWA
jgi:hypothetical protein